MKRTGAWAATGTWAAATLLFLTVSAAEGSNRNERTSLPGRTWTFSFAADTLGQPPALTRSAGGRWVVIEDSAGTSERGLETSSSDSASAPRIVRQLEADDGIAHHALHFLKPRLGDQEASVRFRIRSGEIDPSAGIAIQLDAKGKNGYLVRVSGKSGEIVAHYLLNGKRRDLKYTEVERPKLDEWHTLDLRRVGAVLEVRYDGVLKIKLRDERFTNGNVALWTEDDTVADFAGLSLRSL